jgi:hypothetical protein
VLLDQHSAGVFGKAFIYFQEPDFSKEHEHHSFGLQAMPISFGRKWEPPPALWIETAPHPSPGDAEVGCE